MEGDERSFRVALVAAELVNPAPGSLDALAVLERNGWGVMALPAAWYPDAVAAPLLEQVAEQVDEFARHGYGVVVIGTRAGLDDALATLGREPPPTLEAPRDEQQLEAFLHASATAAPR
jgi:hypothetical protein